MNPVAARQGIISLKIKDAATLYNAYMPFLRNGGLFAPTAQPYALGDEVVLLVSLADESERLSVVGKVVWICPPGAQGNRTAPVKLLWCRHALIQCVGSRPPLSWRVGRPWFPPDASVAARPVAFMACRNELPDRRPTVTDASMARR